MAVGFAAPQHNIGVVCADNAYLADVTKSKDVWHRGGFVRAQKDFARLLFEAHAKLVQAQRFGFRGSALSPIEGNNAGKRRRHHSGDNTLIEK